MVDILRLKTNIIHCKIMSSTIDKGEDKDI